MCRAKHRLIPAIVVVPFGLFFAALPARGQPEPNPIPVSWELKFEPSSIQRINVTIDGEARTFWYMLYTVVNQTGQDVDFHPEIVRVNEIESEVPAEKAESAPDRAPRLTVDPAIVGVRSEVFQAIARRHRRTHPFLATPVSAISRLLQGRENALTSVAVFPDLDPRVSRFTIYFSGLSGEVVTRPNPMYRPDSGGEKVNGHRPGKPQPPRQFVLRKTLAIPYTLPGDERTRRAADPVLGRMEWVMR